MKIILSRKGFDSSAGEGFSPILDNGQMISFPIPEPSGSKDETKFTKLGDINFGNVNLEKLAKEIYPEERHKKLSNENYHLDPDLIYSACKERHPKWKGAFGQAQASLGHLKNHGVGVGDLFLFFGNFKHYEDCNLDNPHSQDVQAFHAVFGYLQVGEVLKVDSKEDQIELKEIYKDHPHIRYADYYKSKAYQKKDGYSNAIYIGSDEILPGIPGWGTFTYSEKLKLSATGYNKRIWKLPACFQYDNERHISYHKKKENFVNLPSGEVLLKTVGRGQEFVIKNPSVEMDDWAMGLIREHRYFEDKRTNT